jgi:hypothetical protein
MGPAAAPLAAGRCRLVVITKAAIANCEMADFA